MKCQKTKMKATGNTKVLGTSNKLLQFLSVFHPQLIWVYFLRTTIFLQIGISPWEEKEKVLRIYYVFKNGTLQMLGVLKSINLLTWLKSGQRSRKCIFHIIFKNNIGSMLRFLSDSRFSCSFIFFFLGHCTGKKYLKRP